MHVPAAHHARDEVAAFVRKLPGDSVTVLELATLRAADAPADCTPLASDCAARIRARLKRSAREPGDWSIELPENRSRFSFAPVRLPNGKTRIYHAYSSGGGQGAQVYRIDDAGLAVTHVTKRQGSPYKLILKKTDALFAQERDARARDEADLAWLSSR